MNRFLLPIFCVSRNKVVIEVDGKIHDIRKKEDEDRSEILINLGLSIIRIENKDVEFDISRVLKKLSVLLRDHNRDSK
jgi:very-short-patch-repair endonuclease